MSNFETRLKEYLSHLDSLDKGNFDALMAILEQIEAHLQRPHPQTDLKVQKLGVEWAWTKNVPQSSIGEISFQKVETSRCVKFDGEGLNATIQILIGENSRFLPSMAFLDDEASISFFRFCLWARKLELWKKPLTAQFEPLKSKMKTFEIANEYLGQHKFSKKLHLDYFLGARQILQTHLSKQRLDCSLIRSLDDVGRHDDSEFIPIVTLPYEQLDNLFVSLRNLRETSDNFRFKFERFFNELESTESEALVLSLGQSDPLIAKSGEKYGSFSSYLYGQPNGSIERISMEIFGLCLALDAHFEAKLKNDLFYSPYWQEGETAYDCRINEEWFANDMMALASLSQKLKMKQYDPDIIRGQKNLRASSMGGKVTSKGNKAKREEVLNAIQEYLEKGNSISNAARLVANKGIGTSSEANRSLYYNHRKKM